VFIHLVLKKFRNPAFMRVVEDFYHHFLENMVGIDRLMAGRKWLVFEG
jgi:hypothetical protein